MNIGKLAGVSVSGETTLALVWDDGHTARIDLAPITAARKALTPLTDSTEFARVALSADGWSIEWPSGIDFGAPQLRRWADEQAGQAMPAAAFRSWMDGHKFNLDRAAEALGISRRTVAYYLSGEQPIPKTVMLATEGYDRRLAA